MKIINKSKVICNKFNFGKHSFAGTTDGTDSSEKQGGKKLNSEQVTNMTPNFQTTPELLCDFRSQRLVRHH